MEDPKLSRGNGLWKQIVMRSGVVTIGVIVLVLIGLALGWRAHTKGRFALLKKELKQTDAERAPLPPRPGGQDPLVLERASIEGGAIPEFLSATLLPGRGLNVLQITALLPKKGEVSLLESPSLEDATKSMSGTGDDANGAASLTAGGAIEAPWAGNIFGPASDDSLNAAWEKGSLHLPASQKNGATAVATGGLLLGRKSFSSALNAMPDGGEAAAVYEAEDFGGHWPSHTRISSTVQLSSRTIEMKVVATNTGNEPEPMGIGWRPKFAILNDDRGQVTLRLPSVTREEIRDPHTGVPSGRLLPVEKTEYDFSSHSGSILGNLSLNDTFVHLKQAALDSGPVAELRDPVNNYGLRITMLSASIKAVHVESPNDAHFVLLEPRFNYDDPFGREWPKEENTGMAMLQPGQSVQLRIRLEIFPLTSATGNHP